MSPPSLSIGPQGRFFTTHDHRPFFWLGDTAWQIAGRTTREEAAFYLDKRCEQGFNVIQMIAFDFMGPFEPNAYGQQPFPQGDPNRPNPAYFDHVLWIIEQAGHRGMTVALLPTWGSMVRAGAGVERAAGEGFFGTPALLASYCHWLAERLNDAGDIVWVLGGDIDPAGLSDHWRSAAEAIHHARTPTPPMISFHPDWPHNSGKSSTRLHDEPWLSFNMVQSSHRRWERNYMMVLEDWHRPPAKPTLDVEGCYENIHEDLSPAKPVFTADDCRQRAYPGVFAGGAGVTYGCSEVYQFWQPGRPELPWGSKLDWREALDLPGAWQMRHLKSLMTRYPLTDRFPDQTLIGEPGVESSRIQAMQAPGASIVLIYLTSGGSVRVTRPRWAAPTDTHRLAAEWFDPRTGQVMPASRASPSDQGTWGTWQAPTSGPGADWVLVLRAAKVES